MALFMGMAKPTLEAPWPELVTRAAPATNAQQDRRSPVRLLSWTGRRTLATGLALLPRPGTATPADLSQMASQGEVDAHHLSTPRRVAGLVGQTSAPSRQLVLMATINPVGAALGPEGQGGDH